MSVRPLNRVALSLGVIVAIVAGLTGPAAAQEQAPAPAPEQSSEWRPVIKTTAAELRSVGVAIAKPGIEPFPHSCRAAGNKAPGLSVSKAMLDHFKARGFSLASLCLALGSTALFDPETGRALPRVVVTDAGNVEITLNFPACFKNAAPLADCRYRFVHWENYELPAEEAADNKAHWRDDLVKLREHVQQSNARGVIWRFEDQESAVEFLRGVTVYEWVLASPELRYGVGYALHGGEGEDPDKEDTNLETYRKKRSWWAIWSDE